MTKRFKCNQCQALMINGVFCHETGCPNTNSRYDVDIDEWIKTRKCDECGNTVDADEACCDSIEFEDDFEDDEFASNDEEHI
jgi:RNase P subunit RPR2